LNGSSFSYTTVFLSPSPTTLRVLPHEKSSMDQNE
jgi:hypothetical protein